MEYEVPQLQAILKDPKTKVIDALVASIALHGIKKGDNARMNFLLDRIIGKVKDQVEHTGADGAALELVIKDYRSNSEPNAD